MRVRLLLLAMSACAPGSRSDEATVDASVSDADPGCVDLIDYVPIEVSGSTPAGPLTALRYAYAFWPCTPEHLVLVEHPRCPSGEEGKRLTFVVDGLFAEPGTVAKARVQYGDLGTDEVEFHVRALSHELFAGRFVVTAPGWNLDLNVALDPYYASCTL